MLDLEQFLGERNLAEADDRHATQFVSNPYAGEEIKALRIVLAELGLAPVLRLRRARRAAV